MDVRCGRCGTEYDFDDALVSERGTTVKCTNCGHQFKVFPGGGGGAPERWIVRKGSGRELVYTSLRDLQRAIAQRQVGPTDMLSRGGGHPLRPLSSIAELEPFFQAQGPGGRPSDAAQRTLLGVAPHQAAQAEDTLPDPPSLGQTFPSAQHPHVATATPVGGVGSVRRSNPPPKPFAATQRSEEEPQTLPRNAVPQGPPRESFHSVAIPMTQMAGQTPQVAPQAQPYATDPIQYAPQAQTAPAAPSSEDGMNSAFRAYQDSFSDEPLPHIPAARTSVLRWVVALVVLGVIAFVGGTVGVKYAKKMVGTPAASAPVTDDRVRKLLEAGDADLSRGDFESAKEQFDKASVLAERDPAVLSALARLEAARADTRWLAIKLIDPNNKTDLDAERAELDGRLARVRKAADAAAAAAPNDPDVLRVRIDALRLSGDLSRARELVGTLGSDTSRPETAYVLAALDLAEPSPAWTTVVDRLRTAAAAERGFGRGRAALVYALASSGAVDEAKAELGKLEASGPTSVVVGRLRAFVQRSAASLPASSGTPLAASALPSEALPPGAVGAAGAGAGAPGEPIPRGGDFRKLLIDASAAKSSGDLTRADALYQAAREQQPNNIEALSGLADVARMRGDNATAGAYYDTVIKQNPTYLPALMASADLKWAGGDRASAVALYKRVTSQADPGSQYAQKAAARIAESGGGSHAPAPTPAEPRPASEPKPTPKPAAPANEPSTPSDIDTSDLPGFHR
jgi:predicted Zn finger-like uncharacterized protein